MRLLALLALTAIVAASLAGCLGDDDSTDAATHDADASTATDLAGPYVGSHPAYGWPTYGTNATGGDAWAPPARHELPETLGALTHIDHVEGVGGGAGIAIWGHHAFAGGQSGPLHVVDISDPSAASVVATLDVPMRDADVIGYPDGRVMLVSTSGAGTVFVTNVTDPAAPVAVVEIEMAHTSHNLAILPGTPILYNSPSGGTATDIWDLSDPADPQLVLDWENGQGCHDITWYLNATVQRGYCAGLGVTQIWDLADAVAPILISEFPIPADSMPISISHLAMVNHDATVLVVGDETGGGAAPACDYYAEVPVVGITESGPSGNLWFYDLSDEQNPVYKSRLSVAAYQSHAMCTSHFGRIVEDRDHLVMSYYGAGVILVDFQDLDNPRIADQWRPISADAAAPGITWDAWYYQGYVFTGDITRGMDVLRVDAPLLPL